MLSSPDLVTSPGAKATFLVGGQIPVVTSSGLGGSNVDYQNYGVQLNVTPTILGNGSVEAVVSPTVSALDYADAVIVSGFQIPAFTVSQLSTDVITRPGGKHHLGRPGGAYREQDDLEDPASLRHSDSRKTLHVHCVPE